MVSAPNDVADDIKMAPIKDFIVRFGFRAPSLGKPLITPSVAEQSWLIDMRTVFMHRSILEQIAQAFWAQHRLSPRFQICGMQSAGVPLLTALLLSVPDTV